MIEFTIPSDYYNILGLVLGATIIVNLIYYFVDIKTRGLD